MQPESKKFTAMVGGKPVIIETGKLAGQAGGAGHRGNSVTVLFSPLPR